MSQRDDDMLPGKMRSDLHDLIPSMPAGLDTTEFLGHAHRQVGRASIWIRAGKRLAAAAAILIAVGIASHFARPAKQPLQSIAEAQPTIIDALRLAKQPGATQAQIDRIAMAAVQLRPEALQ